MKKHCNDCFWRNLQDEQEHEYTHCPECDKRLFFNLGTEWRINPPHVRDFSSRQCTGCGWKEIKYDDGEIVTTKGK